MMRLVKHLGIAGISLVPLWCQAAPGDLDASFAPIVRNAVPPGSVRALPDGSFLLGSSWEGFDRIDGMPTGDRILLGPDGEVSGEPVPGFLEPLGNLALIDGISTSASRDWFSLGNGEWLIPDEADGWLKRHANGTLVPFPTALPGGQQIVPQFVAGDRLWVIRTGGAQNFAEIRDRSDGAIDPSFQPSADWPDQPLQLIPATGGGAWVMGGDSSPLLLASWYGGDKANVIFRIAGDGSFDETVSLVEVNHYTRPSLSPAADGFRVVTGRDSRFFLYYDSAETRTIDWYDDGAASTRRMSFVFPRGRPFTWAEDATGAVVSVGRDGRLQRFTATDTTDTSFVSPGRARSVIALPDGKLLVDGTRRLLADGQPDPDWHVSNPTAPGQVRSIQALTDGRLLVTGRFSSFEGAAERDLVMLNGDGSADPGFVADPRAAFPVSAAFSGGAVYVVTEYPLNLPGGSVSNLVKLGPGGGLDETFDAEEGTQLWGGRFTQVFAQPGGGLIAVRRSETEIPMETVFFLDATGTVQARLPSSMSRLGRTVLPLSTGGCVVGPVIHGADGTQLRQLGGSAELNPVCEWQGGVLFTETRPSDPARQRLRWWRDDRWVAGFAAPPLTGGQGILHATEGDEGTLYLAANWVGIGWRIRRMLPDGSIDEAFAAPEWRFRVRRDAGTWRVAGSSGLENFDPASWDRGVIPSDWAFHPGTSKLWVGGSFNLVDGHARDGIARLEAGGVSPPSGEPRTAYDSWAIAMELGESGPEDDDDGDGVVNALEFLFGSDPHQASEGTRVDVGGEMAVFNYPVSLEALDSTHEVEFSEDLVGWETADETNALLTASPEDGDVTRISVSLPRADQRKLFFRLRAEVR